MSKKFIVLTSGRAGSTALMDFLESFDDVALPNKNFACRDNELLHPDRIKEHFIKYQELCNKPVSSQEDLIERFFEYNSKTPYAGFKSMPTRHIHFGQLIARQDIRFIILTRKDICSTIASFFVAVHTGSWRRSGGPQSVRWQFCNEHVKQVLEHLGYVYKCDKLLGQIENGVRITYEDLCLPDFNNNELNDFFGRTVRIEDPKQPVSAADYVVNWEEFKKFVEGSYQRMSLLQTKK